MYEKLKHGTSVAGSIVDLRPTKAQSLHGFDDQGISLLEKLLECRLEPGMAITSRAKVKAANARRAVQGMLWVTWIPVVVLYDFICVILTTTYQQPQQDRSISPVFGMEPVDSSRRHRRRGRGGKKRHQYSIENLRPGRAPVGLPNSMDIAHLEIESEDSEQDRPPQASIPSIQARLCRLLSSTRIQQAQPELKERPLLTKDMSGLGAQARAAEYAAATAARARQVSREAEDQKLPPKAAPVSLSALAKAQSTNRNKGPKAWKPLNMDEIIESSDDGSTGKESGQATPVASARMMLRWGSSSTNRRVSASSARVDGIKVKIPTAPRAMTTSSVPATITANHSPQMGQTEPLVKFPIRQGNQDIFSSPGSSSHGGLPYPTFPLHLYSHQPDFLDTPSSREPAHFRRFGSMMIPSDLSPTKQQQKFDMLEQMQYESYTMSTDATPADTRTHQMLPQYDPAYYEQSDTRNMATVGNVYGWDVSGNNGTHADYALQQQRHQEHVDVDYGTGQGEGGDGFYAGTTASGHGGMASLSYTANEDSAIVSYHAHITTGGGYRRRQPSLVSISETRGQAHPVVYEYDEPYDRRRKMQSFVAEATQEALARKGKTVLHNPDLYKAKDQPQQQDKRPYNSIDSSSNTCSEGNRAAEDKSLEKSRNRPVPWAVRPRLSDGTWEFMPPPAGQGQQLKINEPPGPSKDELEILGFALNNRIPGSEFSKSEPAATTTNDPINGEPPDRRLHPIDQVGSEEWAKFRPITYIERERVRACMVKAAADLAPKIPRPELFDRDNCTRRQGHELKDSQEWFHTDLRGEQAFRSQLPAIAEKHAKLRRAVAIYANGGSLPKDFNLGIDDGIVASVVIGEVVANLSSYMVGDRKSAEQRKNFHKVKSVPEFATERGGVSGESGSSDSYFDDDEAGFQGAPVRIARDPRFRPQGKEGLKLKPEEEWQNRHDCYGRRVL